MRTTTTELVTTKFKSAARKAIFAIVFFILSYLFLFALSVGLVVLCGCLGVAIMSAGVGFITLILGIGLICLGFIVFFFLIKFVFKKHKMDRSHLIELSEEDAPLLYSEIRDIVGKVQTSFPKKIYLSHEVNASVFYDSTFLSMIFPVKKNLQIGMALINTTSKAELKAILAHEFGHFSQRSMKVGSYVYTVNQIIYNMLYDNEGYGNVVQSFANVSSYFSLFAVLGIKIIQGIQWILRKLYDVVNLQHLELSREMEFHADAIAASTMGSTTFVSSLMRLELSSNSLDKVLSYYEQKITTNVRPVNIYPQQRYVMDTWAKDTDVDFVNGLPHVTMEYLNRYNKSKLIIRNQWASHPNIEDRVEAILAGNFQTGEDDGTPAITLFNDADKLQSNITNMLFAHVTYNGEQHLQPMEEFVSEYSKELTKRSFPKIFNGYYNSYNPTAVKPDDTADRKVLVHFDTLYSSDKIDAIHVSFSLEADINTLKQIQTEETAIKSFEYDGVKYQKEDIAELLPKLEQELSSIKTSLSFNDTSIFTYFEQLALAHNRADTYLAKYKDFFAFDKQYDDLISTYNKVANETQFIAHVNPIAEINHNLTEFKNTEAQLKGQMNSLFALTYVAIDDDSKEKMNAYVNNEKLLYFLDDSYNDSDLEILFDAVNAFRRTLDENYFRLKKILLNEMESLHSESQKISA
jgi:Zn-dependent protease with chaperone function